MHHTSITQKIKEWAHALGFAQVAITDTDLQHYESQYQAWIENQFHGEMDYMTRHGNKRIEPQMLVPGTKSIIMVCLNYLSSPAQIPKTLKNKRKAYIARYALGRDYHKFIRKRLQKLAKKIEEEVGAFTWRAFTDSAPVLEKPLAEKSGLGWIGKNTLLLNRKAGSWFFLGALFTSLTLDYDEPVKNHCGTCSACIDICPTQAIVAPYQLDARRCISYLTIEYRGSIPVEFRSLIGNRIFGCDDCQIVCPWNRFAKITDENDFHPRHQLEDSDLIALFKWAEEDYLTKTEGSALRRVGYVCWLRNLAIALGNAPSSSEIIAALESRGDHPSLLVREHVAWALEQHHSKPLANALYNIEALRSNP